VADWTFLTNHAHVMVCLRRDPSARLRDVADAVGITERAAQRIVSELEAAGYLTRSRDGRRNNYTLHPELPLRHPLEGDHSLLELLDLLAVGGAPASSRS
jgi:hypothetical protein